MADYTSSLNAKTRIGKRCYRLNLERPFDIHCEQSPLVSKSFEFEVECIVSLLAILLCCLHCIAFGLTMGLGG